MKMAAAILLLTTCPVSASAGQTVIPMNPATPATRMCMSGMRDSIAEAAALKNQLATIKTQLRELQKTYREAATRHGNELQRIATECSPEAAPEPPQAPQRAARPAKRLPCKKGRTRNAKGTCGRW